MSRQTDQKDIEQNLGSSLWQFGQASNDLKDFHLNDVSLLKLKPIHKETAKRQLQNFMVMGLLAKQMPLVLPLMTSLNIVALNTKNELEFGESQFNDWLSGQYEDHYQGQSWQKILDGLQPLPEIKKVKNLHKFYMLVYWMLSSLTQPVKQFDGLILKAINAFVFIVK